MGAHLTDSRKRCLAAFGTDGHPVLTHRVRIRVNHDGGGYLNTAQVYAALRSLQRSGRVQREPYFGGEVFWSATPTSEPAP